MSELQSKASVALDFLCDRMTSLAHCATQLEGNRRVTVQLQGRGLRCTYVRKELPEPFENLAQHQARGFRGSPTEMSVTRNCSTLRAAFARAGRSTQFCEFGARRDPNTRNLW